MNEATVSLAARGLFPSVVRPLEWIAGRDHSVREHSALSVTCQTDPDLSACVKDVLDVILHSEGCDIQ